jgi:predicted DNA repair protein MutK
MAITGSLVNKLIILPLCFLLSAFAPVAISVILVWGFLAYEGAEKYMNISSHIKLRNYNGNAAP